MYKVIITLSIILSLVHCECGPGCIKCNAQEQCQLCDLNLGMTLQEGNCVEQSVQGCQVYGQNSKCLFCQPSYFLDSANNKCVKVEIPLDECLYYASDTQCSICEKNYYPSGGNCVEVLYKMDNCKYQENAVYCMQCEDGYTLTSDTTSCMQISEDDKVRNCKTYSNMVCNECAENYIQNKNLYITDIFQNFNAAEFESFNFLYQFSYPISSIENCQPIQVEDCLEYKDAFTCTRCQNGFFLDKGQCTKNPFPKIENCFLYKSHDKCLQCLPGFYLEQEINCKPIPENSIVENCAIATASECTFCQDGYYLQSNKCNLNPTIENCESFSRTDSKCTSCVMGYILTGDGKKCLTEIPNCISYEPSSEADASLMCSKCTNGHYLTTDKACVQGSISNCNEYDGTGTSCVKCLNSFYLENQECKPHDVLSFCSQYSNMVKNECIQCEANHFLFGVNIGCYKADEILNCLDYTSKTECGKCVLGFYLENNVCVQIPMEENCLQRDDNDATQCQICKIGYYINSKNKCEKIYQFQQTPCTIAEGELNGYYKCQQCDPLYFFIELQTDSSVCVSSDRMTDSIAIANCTAYTFDVDNNQYKCKSCGDKFITQTSSVDQQACQETCTANAQVNIGVRFEVNMNDSFTQGYDSQSFEIFNYKGKTCKTEDEDTNCSQLVKNNQNESECAVIKDNSTRIPRLNKDPGQESSFGYEGDFQNVKKHGYSIPTFSFHTNEPSSSAPVFQDPNNYCESYYEYSINNLQTQTIEYQYYCDSCKFGKTGRVISQQSKDYLSCDVDIAGCSSKQYGGLMYDFQAYRTHGVNSLLFRCHECANSDEIPFIHLSLNNSAKYTSNKFYAYGLDLASTTPSESDNLNGDFIACRAPTATGLVIPESDFTKQFPENCALGLYNIDKEKSYRLDTPSNDLSVYCLECAPGYQKKLNADLQVSSCELIEHCNMNSLEQLFNACALCDYGYTWSYDVTSKKINFDECVQNPVKNCQVTDGQKCIYCKKGFYLENDYKCNQLKVEKCANYNYTKQTFYQVYNDLNEPIQLQFPFGMYLSLYQDGCQSCQEGYSLIKTPDLQLRQCVTSYNVENDDLLDSNYLIDNCEIYTGYKKSCERCKVGYLPNEDKSKCLSNINFAHCIQMQTVNQLNYCMSCEDDFYLVEGKCVKGNIEHCMVYEDDKVPAECIECASGMRPSRDNLQCVVGHMENCDLYQNTFETSCQQCMDNTTPLITLDNGSQRCLQKLENQFCDELSTNDAKNNIFKCNKCKSGYFASSSSEFVNPVSFCIPFYKIDKCISYDTTSDYSSNTAKCLVCEDGHYVSQYGLECLQRTITIENCILYENLSAQCKQCSDTFYLSADKMSCLEYPKGVQYCIEYISLTECKTCLEDYYLKDGSCIIVPEESKIINCIEYSADLKCIRCNTNYYQNNEGQCALPEAQNCATYDSPTLCSSCKDGMVFEVDQDTGLRNCIAMEIFKCEYINPETKKCESCGQGYYVKEDGSCGLSNDIPFCVKYLSQNQCQQCEYGFYLSLSKEECKRPDDKLILSERCNDYVYQESPQCNYCEIGFYFSQDECLSCKDSGCAACSPADPAICYVCKSGYYQKQNYGGCTENPKPQVEVVKGIFMMSVKAIFVFLVLIQF